MSNCLSPPLPTDSPFWDRLRPLSKVMPSLTTHHSVSVPHSDRRTEPTRLISAGYTIYKTAGNLLKGGEQVGVSPASRKGRKEFSHWMGSVLGKLYQLLHHLEFNFQRERVSRVVPGKGVWSACISGCGY